MLIFVYGVVFMLYAVPISNIILLITYWIINRKLTFKGLLVVLILLILEFLLFRWAFVEPVKDGGVFGQLIYAEIVGIVALIIQVLSIVKLRKARSSCEIRKSRFDLRIGE